MQAPEVVITLNPSCTLHVTHCWAISAYKSSWPEYVQICLHCKLSYFSSCKWWAPKWHQHFPLVLFTDCHALTYCCSDSLMHRTILGHEGERPPPYLPHLVSSWQHPSFLACFLLLDHLTLTNLLHATWLMQNCSKWTKRYGLLSSGRNSSWGFHRTR